MKTQRLALALTAVNLVLAVFLVSADPWASLMMKTQV